MEVIHPLDPRYTKTYEPSICSGVVVNALIALNGEKNVSVSIEYQYEVVSNYKEVHVWATKPDVKGAPFLEDDTKQALMEALSPYSIIKFFWYE